MICRHSVPGPRPTPATQFGDEYSPVRIPAASDRRAPKANPGRPFLGFLVVVAALAATHILLCLLSALIESTK